MSSAVSARPPGGQDREPGLSPTKDPGALGLTSATGLVIGTVIGAGVFTMPAALAGAGTVSLVVLAVIAVGALVLAVLFGQLTRRVPNSDTVVLKYLPLLFVAVVGWFFVTKANFGAFNASGGSLYPAIGIAAGVALFSFIGVETAAITAKRVKDPRRNVGRASLMGTGAAAIVYLAVSAAVMGLVAHRALVNNGAPFVNAFDTIFPQAPGPGSWSPRWPRPPGSGP